MEKRPEACKEAKEKGLPPLPMLVLSEARRPRFFKHYYSEHMAQVWCTWYPCPVEGCFKLFRVSRNLQNHLLQVAGWPDRKGIHGKKAAAPLPCKNEKEEREREQHSSLVGSVLTASMEDVLNAMCGADHACQGYKPCPTVTHIQ